MRQQRAFSAMGTHALCILDDAHPTALDVAEAEVRRIERLASRFDPRSELMRLNAAGRDRVSADLVRLIHCALELRDATAGRFDPTVYDALMHAGYDRSFDQLPMAGRRRATTPAPAGGRVTLDPATGEVSLAPGTHLDLGGIAKGWTAEQVADVLGGYGSCLVSLGGDIAVRGDNRGRPWPIAVTHGSHTRTIGLSGGGMATSSTQRRCWVQDGVPQHHVIDPATGRPARSDLVQVTVVASNAAHAEAWATALLVAGAQCSQELAAAHDLTAVLVDAHNHVTTTGALA